MIFDDSLREFQIRRVLRALSRQRVALILQPGDVWVIERAMEDNDQTDRALKTCYMRGWVEILEHALPTGNLTPDGKLPSGYMFDRATPMYRLTDSGWSVVNRTQLWVLVSVCLAFLGVVAALR